MTRLHGNVLSFATALLLLCGSVTGEEAKKGEARVKVEVRLGSTEPAEGAEEMEAPNREDKIYVHKRAVLSNADIAEARVLKNMAGKPAIEITFAKDSRKKVADFSGNNIGKIAAIFIDGKLVSAPTIRSKFSEKAEISGIFTEEEVERIVKGVIHAEEKPKAKPKRPEIYDESADGSKQVSAALSTAKKETKHVLLQFGANWCGWCHKLHKVFENEKGVADKLKSDYVVVMIDVNKDHNKDLDTKYGHPIRFGLPVIVVLDAEGKQLTTKNTAELEEGDHHDPKKVLAFLKEWAPKTKP